MVCYLPRLLEVEVCGVGGFLGSNVVDGCRISAYPADARSRCWSGFFLKRISSMGAVVARYNCQTDLTSLKSTVSSTKLGSSIFSSASAPT